MTFVSAKYDYVFKELFRNETVRKYFLSAVLDIPVEQMKTVRLKNTFLWKRYRFEKQGILDVLLELTDGAKCNVEIQLRQQKYWDRRELFYLSKLYVEDLPAGGDYEKLKRCIGISILDYKWRDDERYHSVYRFQDETGVLFTDRMELHVIELRKKLQGSVVDEWITLFNAESEAELKMIKTTNPGIQEAVRELREMNLGRRMRLRFEANMKAISDRKAEDAFIREEGRKEGEARLEALLKLLMAENRGNEVELAVQDEGYREELYRKYGL